MKRIEEIWHVSGGKKLITGRKIKIDYLIISNIKHYVDVFVVYREIITLSLERRQQVKIERKK